MQPDDHALFHPILDLGEGCASTFFVEFAARSATHPDRAYRVACPSPLAPGRQALIYAADTARGLAAFQRFTVGNAAHHGPESNLDYVIVDGAGKIRASGVFRDRCRIGQ